MDTIQLNNEVIRMRKTIKKVKVQAVNRLTRQNRLLRNKKGTAEQLEKNKKRCDRLHDEVRAIKDWKPDDVTFAALAREHALVNRKNLETSRERALHKLIHHPLFVQQFTTFKDSVTPDLLQIKMKYKEGANLVSHKGDDIQDTQTDRATPNRSPADRFGGNKQARSNGSEVGTDSESDDEDLFLLPSRQKKQQDRSSTTSDTEEPSEHHHHHPSLPSPSAAGKNRAGPLTNLRDGSVPSERTPVPPALEGVGRSQEGKRTTRTGMLVTPPVLVKDRAKNNTLSTLTPREEAFSSGKSTLDDQKQKKVAAPLVDLPFLERKEPERKYIPGISLPPSSLEKVAGEPIPRRQSKSIRSKERDPVPAPKRKRPLGGRKNNPGNVRDEESKVAEEQDLHPSWQARKAQKERETLSVAFAGKKITFD